VQALKYLPKFNCRYAAFGAGVETTISSRILIIELSYAAFGAGVEAPP